MSVRPRVSYVVIGRNEQAHLRRCLESVRAQDPDRDAEILYVDSRSTDDSVAIARSVAGVEVLVLDDPHPNAAKGRNAGWRRARGELVQFVDGDAELLAGWTEHAVTAMADPSVAAVCGWFDERHPERSIYNRFADLDWPRHEGFVDAFGGIAMLRRRCLEEAGGFPEQALSGEEPLLALELRRRGYRIRQLAAPMALHDIDTRDFATYWRRCILTGVSFAEQAGPKLALGVPWWQLRTVKNLVAVAAGAAVVLAGVWLGAVVWLGAAALLAADLLRIAVRNRQRAGSLRNGLAYAAHVRFIAVAQTAGALRWLRRRAFRARQGTGATLSPGGVRPVP